MGLQTIWISLLNYQMHSINCTALDHYKLLDEKTITLTTQARAKHQNCHIWELKEKLNRTEKNLKELKLSKLSCLRHIKKKSRIRETPTLLTDADSRTDANLKRLRDLSLKKKLNKIKLRIWNLKMFFFVFFLA